MKRILLVGSQHGDELLGDKLYAYIQAHHAELLSTVDFIVANPKAHAKGIRYIESDMNRSYVQHPDTYEEKKAKMLLSIIKQGEYSLVLDLHTTRCKQDNCFIGYSFTDEVNKFVDASTFKHVVKMETKIAEHSLIGKCDYALSIEVQDDTINDDLLEKLCEAIDRYFKDTKHTMKRHYYEVEGFILKAEVTPTDAKKLRNFKKSSQGYYPILVGENSYKKNTNYLGFKAIFNKESRL